MLVTIQNHSFNQLTQVNVGGNESVFLVGVAALALIFGVSSHDTVDAGALVVAAVF